jgi:4a-hydroxytetrahydrobiopterin dehydratase
VLLGGVPALQRRWRLPDFAQAMALAQAVAALADDLNHHPELHVAWGRLTVAWTTHDAGGVTPLDEQAARATDALAARHPAARAESP